MKPIDHLCRLCGVGRLESGKAKNGDTVVYCPNCENMVLNKPHIAMCFCGHTYPSGKKSGLKCIKNPDRNPSSPYTIMVAIDAPVPVVSLKPQKELMGASKAAKVLNDFDDEQFGDE